MAENTHSADLAELRTLILDLKGSIVVELTRLESKVDKHTARAEERYLQTKAALEQHGRDVEAVHRAIDLVSERGDRTDRTVQELRDRVKELEVDVARLKEWRLADKREAEEAANRHRQALEGAMNIVQKQHEALNARDGAMAAMVTEAKGTNEAVMSFLKKASESPGVRKGLKYAAPAFLLGAFVAGFVHALLMQIPAVASVLHKFGL